MALHDWIARQPGGIGLQARLNRVESYASCAHSPRKLPFEHNSDPLAAKQLLLKVRRCAEQIESDR